MSASPAAVETAKVVTGILGVGGIGMNHLNAFLDHKDVEIACVCEVDQKRLDDAMNTASKCSAQPSASEGGKQVPVVAAIENDVKNAVRKPLDF